MVIHIGRIDTLNGIAREAGRGLRIGPLTPMRTLEKSSYLAQTAAEEARPNPGISVRASARYRREMVKVWSRSALKEAWGKAEA